MVIYLKNCLFSEHLPRLKHLQTLVSISLISTIAILLACDVYEVFTISYSSAYNFFILNQY